MTYIKSAITNSFGAIPALLLHSTRLAKKSARFSGLDESTVEYAEATRSMSIIL
jgi:hypothetical protein